MNEVTKNTLMTTDDVATYLGIARNTVYALIREGKIESIKLGYRTIRVPSESVERYVSLLKVTPSGEDIPTPEAERKLPPTPDTTKQPRPIHNSPFMINQN